MIKRYKIWIAVLSALLAASFIAIGVTVPILLSNNNNNTQTRKEVYVLDSNTIKEMDSLLCKDVFDKLNSKIMDIIYKYLKTHNVIRTRIYIKPYSLDPNNAAIYKEPVNRGDLNWYFNDNSQKRYIDSEPVNVYDYDKIFNIFSNYSIFNQHFEIYIDRNLGPTGSASGWRPGYQNAKLRGNDTFIRRVFKNDIPSSIIKGQIRTALNTLNDVNWKTISKILAKSDQYDNWWDAGPKYLSNNTLSFAILPYMEANERTNLKKHVIDEILKTDTNGSSILKDTIIEQVNVYAQTKDNVDKQKYAIYLQGLSNNPYDYIKINYKDNNVAKEIRIDEYFVKESEKSITNTMSLLAKEIRDRQYDQANMETIGIVPYFSSVYGSWWFVDYIDENQVMNMIDTPDYVYMDYAQSNKNSIYNVEKWDASSSSIDKNKSNATMGLLEIDTDNKWLVIDNFIGMSNPIGKDTNTKWNCKLWLFYYL